MYTLGEYKPRFFVFYHDGDHDLLEHCIARLHETWPESQIVLARDKGHASYFSSEPYISSNIETEWPRNGNMTGPHAIYGEMALYRKYTKLDEFAVKVDPDCFIVNGDLLKELFSPRYGMISFQCPAYYFGGAFLGWRADVLARMARLLPADINSFGCNCRDDYVLGSYGYMASLMVGARPANFQRSGPCLEFGAYNYNAKDQEAYIKRIVSNPQLAMINIGGLGISIEDKIKVQKALYDALVKQREAQSEPESTTIATA